MLLPTRSSVLNCVAREREEYRQREALLRAAAPLFAARDYASLSLREIIRAAERAEGVLLLVTETKAELYLQLIERGLCRVCALVEGHLLLRTPHREAVGAIVQAHLSLLESYPLPAYLKREPVFPRLGLLRRELARRLAEGIRQGQATGLFRPGNAESRAEALLGLIEAAARRRVPAPGLPERADHLASLALRAIAA